MIVADSNVIAYLLLPSGEQTKVARRAYDLDPVWAAPALWRSEFRNVLALQMRHRQMSLSEAVTTQAEAEALLAGHEHAVDSARVLALAAQSGRTAYDCEFVAVARALGVRLITADRQVLASFPDVAVALREFAAA